MLTKSIKSKIEELFYSTADNVGVMYSKKIKNGVNTDEKSITFIVEKKLPINEIPDNEILPSSVEIDGITYITDVIEGGKNILLACDNDVLNECYQFRTIQPLNQNTVRPIQGGLQINSNSTRNFVGTLGFLAVDLQTNALVGVTNNHVVVKNATYTANRDPFLEIENESFTFIDYVYQRSYNSRQDIGDVVRYVPLNVQGINYVDGALISIYENVVQTGPYVDELTPKSWMQYGLSGITSPMQFATTAEIDSLITNPPDEVWSAGRTTGAKQGICGLKVNGIGLGLNLNITSQGLQYLVGYGDIISFKRINYDCDSPIVGGDSGSALIGVYNGVPKIIGLVFAGAASIINNVQVITTGFACRIDRVAEELGIGAWDGINQNYIKVGDRDFFTVPNGNYDKLSLCSGETYWQVGLTTSTVNCDCGSLNLTVSADSTPVGFKLSGYSAFDVTIDWGDSNISRYYGAVLGIYTHTYTTNGEFIIKVYVSDCNKISYITLNGTSALQNPGYYNRITNIEGLENFRSLHGFAYGNGIMTEFNPLVPLPQNLEAMSISYNPLNSYVFSLPLPATMNSISFIQNGFSTNDVNNWLIYFDSCLPADSDSFRNIINIRQNGASPPSGAGIIAKNNLTARGWLVITD